MLPTREEMKSALELRHTKAVQDRLAEASVAVCGLGGLGSHIAVALARCGIGGLHLLDFDVVELSNLNRQQYGLAQLGRPKTEALKEELLSFWPYMEIRTDRVRLTEDNAVELLAGERYICEAFDTPEAKAMLTDCVLTRLPDAYLVGASGMAGFGNSNAIVTRRITERYYLCGDGVSGLQEGRGLMAPRVMLCAAHQANQVLELILKGAGIGLEGTEVGLTGQERV